jgi:hypothetical protein
MRGEFLGVWSETWREIWEQLASQESAPDDLYCELYRELSAALKAKPTPESLADIIDDSVQAKEAFQNAKAEDFEGERTLTEFFERAHDTLADLAGDSLSNPYFNLLFSFIDKFSLRYDLRRPCTLCPTVQGIFASLMRDLQVATLQDPHLNGLMKDFQDAVRDLRTDCSDGRIRICIAKQVNLLEALGSRVPGVTANTVGEICDQVGTWPHDSVKDAMKNLYKFTNNYPGIRHGGTPASALRLIEMRDMVAVSVLLAGFLPYLTNELNADLMYRGT